MESQVKFYPESISEAAKQRWKSITEVVRKYFSPATLMCLYCMHTHKQANKQF